ncbi:DsbA family protein [Nitratireductor aquimarinus]|uniref:DsbA family protein n=1 Tax=Nitratireductor aquimarinus TaxID=889300 RepID=UPI001CD514E0|nr:DsbA family protein [Nitratireductor aquimarinus]MCA1302806.1 DsbA family protein [Nitratireductor aquimarinus]
MRLLSARPGVFSGRGHGGSHGDDHRGGRRFLKSLALVLALFGTGFSADRTMAAMAAGVDAELLLEAGGLEEKVLGEAGAPVTIVEYASMTCAHCARYHTETLPELKRRYIETGRVRYIVRGIPTDPRAEAGLMLAYCSKGNYFNVSDLLYKTQSEWAWAKDGRSALLKTARIAGFSQKSFEACLTDRELLDEVRAMRNWGLERLGIEAVPTFFINGMKHSGAMSIDEMSAIIDGML